MANDPLFVEIYSPREGVWAWSVTFDDLGAGRYGTADTFTEALDSVRSAVLEPVTPLVSVP